MKKVSVTFKAVSGTKSMYKVVKVINTTRYLPGDLFKETELKDIVRNGARDCTYIII